MHTYISILSSRFMDAYLQGLRPVAAHQPSAFQLCDLRFEDKKNSNGQVLLRTSCLGYDAEGRSVCAHVYGFEPRLYVRVRSGDPAVAEQELRKYLIGLQAFKAGECLLDTHCAPKLRGFKCNMDGSVASCTFIRIRCTTRRAWFKIKNSLQLNVGSNGSQSQNDKLDELYCTMRDANVVIDDVRHYRHMHEANVSFDTVFITDHQINFGDWLALSGEEALPDEPSTQCDVEVVATNLQVVPQQQQCAFAVMAFDIEVVTLHKVRYLQCKRGECGECASLGTLLLRPDVAFTEAKSQLIAQARQSWAHSCVQALQVDCVCTHDTLKYGASVTFEVRFCHTFDLACNDDSGSTQCIEYPSITGNEDECCAKLCERYNPGQNTALQVTYDAMQEDELSGVSTATFCCRCTTELRDRFPNHEDDPICCIGIATTRRGRVGTQRLLLSAAACNDLPNCAVASYSSEAELLLGFAHAVRRTQPFLLMGYNSAMFDTGYIHSRAERVLTPAQFEQFLCMSQWKNLPCKASEYKVNSNAFGDNKFTTLRLIPNLIECDMYMYVKSQPNFRFTDYTLRTVCNELLPDRDGKLDMAYATINATWGTSPAACAAVGEYCVRDAEVVVQLEAKIGAVDMLQAVSQTTFSGMRDLWHRGNEIKIDQLLYRNCRERGIVKTSPTKEEYQKQDYQGATVLDPVTGFYGAEKNQCVATLDFASLYPSIILGWNLGYMTYVEPGYHQGLVAGKQVKLFADRDGYRSGRLVSVISACAKGYCTSAGTLDCNGALWSLSTANHIVQLYCVLPASVKAETLNGTVFVQSVKGVIPNIVARLLALRASIRKEMKKLQTDESKAAQFRYSVLDNNQKAAKVIANSVYGFTAAYRYPCYHIGKAITWKARNMLADTKAGAEAEGYSVIYGDTDSIMVVMPCDVRSAFPLARQLASKLSDLFPDSVVLEFEKVYAPWLLVGRKMYAGRMYETVDEKGVLDVKGVATKRRDCPPWCARVQKSLFNAMFFSEELRNESAQEACLRMISQALANLRNGTVAVDELQVTRQMKSAYSYKNSQQPHLHVTALKNQRVPGSGAQVGERVPFVFIKSTHTKRYLKAEDPAYAIKHNLKVDADYYVERLKSVTSIFQDILGVEWQRVFHRQTHRYRDLNSYF